MKWKYINLTLRSKIRMYVNDTFGCCCYITIKSYCQHHSQKLDNRNTHTHTQKQEIKLKNDIILNAWNEMKFISHKNNKTKNFRKSMSVYLRAYYSYCYTSTKSNKWYRNVLFVHWVVSQPLFPTCFVLLHLHLLAFDCILCVCVCHQNSMWIISIFADFELKIALTWIKSTIRKYANFPTLERLVAGGSHLLFYVIFNFNLLVFSHIWRKTKIIKDQLMKHLLLRAKLTTVKQLSILKQLFFV